MKGGSGLQTSGQSIGQSVFQSPQAGGLKRRRYPSPLGHDEAMNLFPTAAYWLSILVDFIDIFKIGANAFESFMYLRIEMSRH